MPQCHHAGWLVGLSGLIKHLVYHYRLLEYWWNVIIVFFVNEVRLSTDTLLMNVIVIGHKVCTPSPAVSTTVYSTDSQSAPSRLCVCWQSCDLPSQVGNSWKYIQLHSSLSSLNSCTTSVGTQEVQHRNKALGSEILHLWLALSREKEHNKSSTQWAWIFLFFYDLVFLSKQQGTYSLVLWFHCTFYTDQYDKHWTTYRAAAFDVTGRKNICNTLRYTSFHS